jgi:hypothetical protein
VASVQVTLTSSPGSWPASAALTSSGLSKCTLR